MNCPKCGATVRETDKFCSECGSTLDAKKSDGPCRACGQMVPLGAKFCGNCGASEPHSVPAGATGETVVARAPSRPTGETLAAEAEPSSDAKVMTEGVVPPATDDADTGVFRRMIEEELEATINTRTLRQVRRGSGAPSQVQPDPTQEHHVGKPVGFAFGGKGSTRTTKDEAVERAAKSEKPVGRPSKAKPKPTTKSTPVAAGPKRPVGLAKSPKRPKPAATGDKLRVEDDEDAPTEVVDVAPLREPSAIEEVDVDVDVDLDDDDDADGDADAGVDEDDGGDIWPDITEEVAEVRFYLLQGLEDDAKVALAQLKEKHGMHPELAVIQAELDGESPPQRKKRKKAAAKRPDKGAAVERIEIGGIATVEEVPRVDTAVAPAPTSPAARGDTVVSAYVPVEPPLMDDGPESAPTIARIAKVQEGAPPKGRGVPTMKGEAVDEGATTTGRRSRSKEGAPPGRARAGKGASDSPSGRTGTTAPDDSLPASAPAVPEMEISVEIQARPGPSRTGATVPMDKLPSDASAPAEAPKPAEPPKSSRPSKPPPPPTTTPRSTPSVPPLRKPPTRPMTEPPSAKSSKKKSVPPPPMPVVPSTSDDATEVSGDIYDHAPPELVGVPRGDTVVAAYPPEPPADLAKDEPSLVDSSDRTVVSRAPQPPAPYSGTPPTTTRNTVVPTTKAGPPPPAPFGGEAPPGGTLVPGTTPPAGGFADADDASSAVARHVAPSGTPPMPMAEPKPGSEAEAAANAPPPEPGPEPEPEPRNETVIARAPQAPAPFHGEAPVTLSPAQTIRLVMLGSRGQTVAERTIRPGDSLDVGRDPAEPWGDDEYLEERHARITPAAGGGVLVDDYDGSGPVFRQVSERTRIRAGDQLRVGQSLIHYDNGDGTGWGQLLIYTNGAEPPKVHPLGGSGAKVGRENGEITFANDTYVSGEHCRFLCEGTSVFIEDLDSSNGTYVRVRKGEPVELGSLLLLGHTQFRIRPA